jgi:hypothetical protein
VSGIEPGTSRPQRRSTISPYSINFTTIIFFVNVTFMKTPKSMKSPRCVCVCVCERERERQRDREREGLRLSQLWTLEPTEPFTRYMFTSYLIRGNFKLPIIIIQFNSILFMYVPSQQPQGPLQTQHSTDIHRYIMDRLNRESRINFRST